VRAHTGWGHTQLKTHLHRLEELEYLIVHRGGRGQTFVYELNWSGLEAEKSGASRPLVGGISATGRPSETRMNTGWPVPAAAFPSLIPMACFMASMSMPRAFTRPLP
jgi:hypothetical protein